MNWLDKYRPIYISQLRNNLEEINKAKLWIEKYKKNSQECKKVCLILGTTGVGKTLLADVLFKEYNYDKIELNSSDMRSQKKIGDFLKKSLTYRNIIDMFNEGTRPIGILLDEIDTICKLADKGGFTEFLSILKNNEKCTMYKKNLDEKKKTKKNSKKMTVDDYIELYNPIICTSNDINDKKLTELKKFSEVIHLNKPTIEEMILIIDDLYNKNNQKIDIPVKTTICIHVNGDIRALIILLEDLYYYSNGDTIDIDMYDSYKKAFNAKEEDIQLIESTRLLMTNTMSITQSQLYFDIDCLLIPLMLYHNSLEYIKQSDDTLKKKIDIYKNIMESLCIHDTIQTNIFEAQDWDELYDIAGIYGASIPNYNFTQLKNKKNDNNNTTVEFTSLLNKISQMFTNKKLLNNSRFSIGKVNFDNDEIIYLTEIMSHYFEEYKTGLEDKEDKDNDDEEDDDIEEVCTGNYIKPRFNNSNLIKYMNNYNMNISGLENILKIEKLNQKNEKRKKKFTIKIKKDITHFLINQDKIVEIDE